MMAKDMQSTTSQSAFLRAERHAQAMHLRRTTNMSLQAIGDQLGMSKVQAHRIIKKNIKNVLDKEAGELLVHELERLQQLENNAMEQCFGFRIEMDSSGKPIYEPLFDSDGRAVRDPSGAQVVVPRQDFDVVNAGRAALLRIIDQRSKLLGLYTTKIQSIAAGGQAEDRIVEFRIVDSNGDGRMAAHSLPCAHAKSMPAAPSDADAAAIGATSFSSHTVNGVEVVSFEIPDQNPANTKVWTIPPPSKLQYHDSGNPPDPNAL